VKGLEGVVEMQCVAKSVQRVDEMQLEEGEEEEKEEGCQDWARTGPVLAEIRAKIASFQEMLSETLEGFVGAPPSELDVQLAEHGAHILQCLQYSLSLHIYIIFTLNNSLKLAFP
jgi:hypothetical protein